VATLLRQWTNVLIDLKLKSADNPYVLANVCKLLFNHILCIFILYAKDLKVINLNSRILERIKKVKLRSYKPENIKAPNISI
jgi:hypothetical protein